MTQNDAEVFNRMLTFVAEQYGKAMSPGLLQLYFDGLSNLSIEQIKIALNRHVRDTDIGQFMPKVADIIRIAQPDLEAEAIEALRRMDRNDPLTTKVIESMGGWKVWGMRDEQEWHAFGGPEFIKRYQIYAKQEREKNAIDHMTNLSLPVIK